eukprot:1863493-Lingulodinium_polyedra.AAC.1
MASVAPPPARGELYEAPAMPAVGETRSRARSSSIFSRRSSMRSMGAPCEGSTLSASFSEPATEGGLAARAGAAGPLPASGAGVRAAASWSCS